MPLSDLLLDNRLRHIRVIATSLPCPQLLGEPSTSVVCSPKPGKRHFRFTIYLSGFHLRNLPLLSLEGKYY